MNFDTFPSGIQSFAESSPDAPALLRLDGSVISYGALWSGVLEFRLQLESLGIGRETRVALVHSENVEFAALLAMAACLVTIVPLNANLTREEFGEHLGLGAIDLIILEKRLDSEVTVAARNLGLPIVLYTSESDRLPGSLDLVDGMITRQATLSGFAQPEDIALIIMTSGTASTAKVVHISQGQLAARSTNTGTVIGLTPADRCLNFMPLFHIGGLSAGLTGSLLSGCAFATTSAADVDDLERLLTDISPTVISAGYTVCGSIADKAESMTDSRSYKGSGLRLVRSGAGHLDREVVARLQRAFDVPVMQVYGSTETGFMAFSQTGPDGEAPEGLETYDGCQIEVLNERGTPAPKGQRGEIVARGAGLATLIGDQVQTNNFSMVPGSHRTGDEGYFDASGLLRITGRLNEMLNRGGQKISPAEIDAVIMRHKHVKAVASFPIAHPTLGDEVGAVVVPISGASISAQEIASFAEGYLAPYKRPKKIILSDAIPLSANGKIQRRNLSSQFGIHIPAAAASTQSEAFEVELSTNGLRLREIWQDVLELDEISADENFFMLGGDSLQSVELALATEEALNVQLPPYFVYAEETIRELAEAIDTGKYTDPVTQLVSGSGRTPMFVIHDIDGDMKNIQPLAHRLSTGQPIFGVSTSPHLAVGQVRSIEDLARDYAERIKGRVARGPIFLLGYSFGGLVAFETARQLRESGFDIPLVTLVDSNLGKPKFQLSWLERHVAGTREVSPWRWPEYVVKRLWSNLAHYVRQVLDRPEERVAPQVALFRKLTRQYCPPKYAGDVLFVRARGSSLRRYEVWRHATDGTYIDRAMDGDHNSMMFDPHVDDLAEIISSEVSARLKS